MTETLVSSNERVDFRMEPINLVVRDATTWASEKGHETVGLEFALIGLSYDSDIKLLLKDFGVGEYGFRNKATNVISKKENNLSGKLPLSEEFENAIGSAVRKANIEGSNVVAATYLLKSILEQKNSTVDDILIASDIDWIDLVKLLDQNTAPLTRINLLRKSFMEQTEKVLEDPNNYSNRGIDLFVNGVQEVFDKLGPRTIRK